MLLQLYIIPFMCILYWCTVWSITSSAEPCITCLHHLSPRDKKTAPPCCSSFISFHLCAFCIGVLFGASPHLLSPASPASITCLLETRKQLLRAAPAACYCSLIFRTTNKQITVHPHSTVIIHLYLLYMHRNTVLYYCTIN